MSKEESEKSFSLPSSPADRKKIRATLQDIAEQLQQIDDKKSSVRDISAALHKEYKIPKKIISKLAQTVYKHNYGDVAHESTVFELCYEGIVEAQATVAPAAPTATTSEDE